MAGKPLAGMRIIDLGWVWSGPYACMMLAHLGADVIRIESSLRPCLLRILPPWPGGKPGSAEAGGGTFTNNNLGKRSISLDLKTRDGLAVARRLIASSDAVVNNYAAGVIERLGLGYEDLRKLKSDIILVCLSGMGDTGPYREFVAYGQGQAAMSGFTRFSGIPGRAPKNAGFVLADPVAGAHGAFAVLAALRHKHKTGQGQFVDMSQWEATLQMVGDAVVGYQLSGREPEAMGNRHSQMSPHGLFRCSDAEGEPGKMLDAWVTIVAADDNQWRALCFAMGLNELASDRRFETLQARKANEAALESIVGTWTRPRSADAVTATLQAVGIAAFPSRTHKEVFEDPNLRARGFFADLTHPAHGRHPYPGVPWRMEGAPVGVERPAPTLGQHSKEILAELGYSQVEIEQLQSVGALT